MKNRIFLLLFMTLLVVFVTGLTHWQWQKLENSQKESDLAMPEALKTKSTGETSEIASVVDYLWRQKLETMKRRLVAPRSENAIYEKVVFKQQADGAWNVQENLSSWFGPQVWPENLQEVLHSHRAEGGLTLFRWQGEGRLASGVALAFVLPKVAYLGVWPSEWAREELAGLSIMLRRTDQEFHLVDMFGQALIEGRQSKSRRQGKVQLASSLGGVEFSHFYWKENFIGKPGLSHQAKESHEYFDQRWRWGVFGLFLIIFVLSMTWLFAKVVLRDSQVKKMTSAKKETGNSVVEEAVLQTQEKAAPSVDVDVEKLKEEWMKSLRDETFPLLEVIENRISQACSHEQREETLSHYEVFRKDVERLKERISHLSEFAEQKPGGDA